MNEFVLDVLLYLLENFSLPGVRASDPVREDLDDAGFMPDEIEDAFDWLKIAQNKGHAPVAPASSGTLRLYTETEQRVLDGECRGYLLRLERSGVLGAGDRELIIDRLMALADDEFEAIDIEQVKWVALMVLFSADADDIAQARMEATLFAHAPQASH